MSDYSPIPDELKDRDQWLLWDASAEAPRRPHWRGDFGVSWTNPEDWHSFDEAAEAAEDHDSWGIGYVFARNNDDYPRGLYGALDLDGCADENGVPKDWLPSLQPFFDAGAYMEKSPSGTGVHIPLVGFEPPEWWSNVHFSEEEHEGVEAYGSKFFTFTGDQLQKSGTEVVDDGDFVDEWLLEVYTKITGEMPEELQPDDEQRETEKSREEIEEIETTTNYDDVLDAVDHLRPSDLRLSSSYTEDENGDWESWDPGYRSSSSRKSLKRHKASGLFKDFAEAEPSRCTWFGVLDIFAAENGIISRPWDGLKDDDWSDAIKAARSAGAPIPEYSKSNQTPSPSQNPPASPSGQTMNWEEIRGLFADDQVDDKRARRWAAIALTERHDYIYVDTDDRLLKYYEDDGVFEPGGERHVRKVLARELGMQFSTHDRNEVLATVQDLSAVDVTTLNAEEIDEKLLCLKNGVLDLETRVLKEHDPKYKFTQTVPVEYDPEASAPEIEAFLDDVTQSKDERDTLVEMIGATLHPQYLKSKFLFLFGEGSNGKGVYFELINRLLGAENVEGRGLHELADNRFAKADLHGKLANIGGDIDDRKLQNVGTIKRLTSNTDPITAERKFGQPFKFVNSATLFFAANEPPAIDDMKRSMGRRLVPIHMATEFVENPDPEDPFQKEAVDQEELLANMTTEEELSGLLNMALDGMDRLRKTSDVSLKLSPMERLEFYQRFSDPIYRFANDCLDKEPGITVEKADVYEIYKSFSRAEGHGVRHNNVFWREFRRVFHFEETQPRLDDGSKGPRKLLDTRVTEKGLKYAPEHLEQKYGHLVEDTEEKGSSDSSTPTFEAIEPGRHTVKATVAEVLEPKPWQQGRGHLVDEASNIMPYVAEGSENPLSEFAEGDTVQIKNARVATDRDGVLRIEISGVCEVSSREEAGTLTVDDREIDNQQVEETATDGSGEVDADTDEESEEDEGSGKSDASSGVDGEEMKPLIQMYFNQQPGDVEHADLVEHLREKGAVDDQIEFWINKLRTRKGLILEPEEEGVYRWGGR